MTLLLSSSHGCFYNFGRPGLGPYLYPSINSAAFRGATALTLIDKLNSGEACVDDYKLIILLIGGNDVDTKYSVRTLCADILDVIELIRRFNKDAHITVLSVLPRLSPKNSTTRDYMDKAVDLNKALSKRLRDMENVSFARVHKKFLVEGSRWEPNAEFYSADGVHFNDMGVRRLAGMINSIFEKHQGHKLDEKVRSCLRDVKERAEEKDSLDPESGKENRGPK